MGFHTSTMVHILTKFCPAPRDTYNITSSFPAKDIQKQRKLWPVLCSSSASLKIDEKKALIHKKRAYEYQNILWNLDPENIKNIAEIIENRGAEGSGGVPGEPREAFWAPKLPMAEKRSQNGGSWHPPPPPKRRPKMVIFCFFGCLFLYPF